MPAASSHRVPSYRLHKPSGQAVVTLDSRDHYLGVYDTDKFVEENAVKLMSVLLGEVEHFLKRLSLLGFAGSFCDAVHAMHFAICVGGKRVESVFLHVKRESFTLLFAA